MRRRVDCGWSSAWNAQETPCSHAASLNYCACPATSRARVRRARSSRGRCTKRPAYRYERQNLIWQRSDPSLYSGADDLAEQANDVDRRAVRMGFAGNLEERHVAVPVHWKGKLAAPRHAPCDTRSHDRHACRPPISPAVRSALLPAIGSNPMDVVGANLHGRPRAERGRAIRRRCGSRARTVRSAREARIA